MQFLAIYRVILVDIGRLWWYTYDQVPEVGGKTMNTQVTEVYVRQFSEIVRGLSEEKLKEIITFARRVREEVEKPKLSLSAEEILALASERAAELRRQPRPVVEAQYRTMLQALEAEVSAKGIEVERYPGSRRPSLSLHCTGRCEARRK